jgi:hypothetical protein
MKSVLLCGLVLCFSGCATALEVTKATVNLADVAMGQAALAAEAKRQAAEDRCLEVVQPGEVRDKCLEDVRKAFRPLFDAFGIWRLARATWNAALGGGTAEELAKVRSEFCALRVQLADRIKLFDWPGDPCSSPTTAS